MVSSSHRQESFQNILNMNQDIQAQLLKISNVLDDQSVKELVFLCGNHLTAKDKEEIKDGNALFEGLQKKGLISDNDLSFLKEIFCKIGRNDILRGQLSMTQSEIADLQKCPNHISSYRSLLYDISQELDSKDVKNVKFYLYSQKAKLRNTDSMLDVLIEMEKDLSVKEDKLDTLKKTLTEISRMDLHQRILTYENQGRQATYLDSTDSTQGKMPIKENPTNQPKKTKAHSGNGEILEQYNLDKTPHGWCVILNNKDFAESRNMHNVQNLQDRIGTDRDAETIRRVFEKRNYTVEEHKNLTKQDMLNIMKMYQNNDHSNKDSFICFILSHGDQGIVFGVDGKEVLIKDLTSCVNGENCPSLVGKPKVFFIQACQGDELDKGAPYEKDSSTPTYESDGGSLPVTADFLIAYASSEDYVSLRGSNGSVYIQKLCETLEEPHFVQKDLKKILTTVQKTIADEVYKVEHKTVSQYGKQMPSHTSQLRKKLILPPPGNNIPSH